MTTLLAFVFLLGVLIFVHELGHFLMARRLGVRVLTFSLGFGPKILRFQRGDTEYCVSAIPLGGYVKMAGETANGAREGRPDEFLSRSKWERFQVLVMGPVMNIVLAVVLTAGVFALGGADVPVFQNDPPVVGAVTGGSPAERAGIKAGDRIVSMAGQPMGTWEDVYRWIGSASTSQFAILVRRGAESIEVQTALTDGKVDVAGFGVMPDVCPHVVSVMTGGPADRAGVRPGDLVVSVHGQRVVFQSQLTKAISRHANERITLTVRRDGQQIDLYPTPAANGRIGIVTGDALEIVKPGLLAAVEMSLKQNVEFSRVILRTLGGLLTRSTSPSDLAGPVAIAQMSGQAAATGLRLYLLLMALISLNLGLVNLLPIPVLDGGHIFILAIEGVGRRDLSVKVKEKMLLAGFAVLMILMVTVIYNDLTRIGWIQRLMFWR